MSIFFLLRISWHFISFLTLLCSLTFRILIFFCSPSTSTSSLAHSRLPGDLYEILLNEMILLLLFVVWMEWETLCFIQNVYTLVAFLKSWQLNSREQEQAVDLAFCTFIFNTNLHNLNWEFIECRMKEEDCRIHFILLP